MSFGLFNNDAALNTLVFTVARRGHRRRPRRLAGARARGPLLAAGDRPRHRRRARQCRSTGWCAARWWIFSISISAHWHWFAFNLADAAISRRGRLMLIDGLLGARAKRVIRGVDRESSASCRHRISSSLACALAAAVARRLRHASTARSARKRSCRTSSRSCRARRSPSRPTMRCARRALGAQRPQEEAPTEQARQTVFRAGEDSEGQRCRRRRPAAAPARASCCAGRRRQRAARYPPARRHRRRDRPAS